MVEENGSTKTIEFLASKGLKIVEENGQENLSENAKSDGKNENVVEEIEIGQEPGWRRFKQWVHCFCVVTFDLELGQTIEVVYPGNAQLSQSERTDLCYLAFPDSNCSPIATSFSGSTSSPTLSNGQSRPIQRVKEASSSTDSAHHFRVRRTSPDQMDKFIESIAQQFPPYLRPDGRFFYGFAHFRRQRDPRIARGYSQKSIVLLTHLPFVALFSRVLTEVALAYFTEGENAIETACRQIGQFWPAPIPGGDRLLSLPIFGLRFCCSIPVDSNAASSSLGEVDFSDADFEGMKGPSAATFPKKQSIETEEEAEFEIIDYLHCNILHLHSIHEPDQHFHAGIKRLLPHLHLLWELVLLGEPLLILAPNPSLGSSLVHSLISLISPLRYNGDHRPYFTIHDSDFNEMSSRQNRPMNSCILGVTNPFFLKAFAHWPHILKLNTIQPQMRRERSESRLVRQLKAQPAAQFVLGNLKRSGTASKGLDLEGEEENNGGDEQQQKMIKRLSDLSLLESRSSGFLCAHRQFLAQDKTLPRQLLRTPSDSPSQWAALRWFFAELTQNFMSPLESFISTLLPLRRELSPFQSVPQMRPFSLEQFLLSLRHFGHPGVKGDWQGLYRQFVARSPNFIGWLRQRQKDIERQLRLEHMDLIANFNFTPEILAERNQIEIVDLVMKLTNRLGELNERQKSTKGLKNQIQMDGSKNSPIKKNFLENQRAKLQNRLSQILDSVDDELKMVLLSNPAFRKAAEEAEQK